MPNHVTNVVALKGERRMVDAVMRAIQEDARGFGSISFQKIIPMPESLNMLAGSCTDQGLKEYRKYLSQYSAEAEGVNAEASEQQYLQEHKEIEPRDWALGKQAYNNIVLYGAPTWYEWCVQNWGTKWDAYDMDMSEAEDGVLRFFTAWSAPHPVIQKLAELCPEVEIEHSWADEDIGSNCGKRNYVQGVLSREFLPAYGRSSVDFAAEVMGVSPEDYGLRLNSEGTDYIYEEGMHL